MRIVFTALALALLTTACIPSLNSLYRDENDLEFLPELVGTWTSKDDTRDRWVFERRGQSRFYRLVHTDENGAVATLEAALVRIGDNLLMDLTGQNTLLRLHTLPLHTFYQVYRVRPTLRMASLDPQWIEDYLDEHPGELGELKGPDKGMLTADTEVLRGFLDKHLGNPDALAEAFELVPVPRATPDAATEAKPEPR
jgi:hypothetical protein